jgi:hypothetical protein
VAGEGLKNAPLGRSLLPKLEGIFMDVEMGSRESDAAIHGLLESHFLEEAEENGHVTLSL